MDVLVTGVAGFMGSHVAQHCLELGYNVVGVDDLSGGRRENVPDGVRFEVVDVSNPASVRQLWDDNRFGYVYHLAAYAAEGLSHFIRRYNYTNNVIASINLINESIKHDVKCFVFTSSIAVYGENQLPMNENMTPMPEDPYGIAKYAVELDLRAARKMFGLNYVIFRPHNVYGERQNIADKYRNVIAIFMTQALQGKPMTIFGDGTQTRAFTYVDDVAPIIARAPSNEKTYNQVFNIGADTPYSISELAKEVARALSVELRIEHLPPRNEVQHAFSSHDKIRAVFDLPEPVSLREGLRRMTAWVRAIGQLSPTESPEIEIHKNLHPVWL